MTILRRWIPSLMLGAGLVMCAPNQSHAEAYSFSCITGNSPSNCDVLETQVLLEVTADVDPTLVNFRFTNVGISASSIADVYFNDLTPALLGSPAYITSSRAVRQAICPGAAARSASRRATAPTRTRRPNRTVSIPASG